MDTKGIDLTKCVNLRFRLRIDGTNYFGRIGTDERGRNCLFCDDGKAYWIADSSEELQRYGKSDFEIFPRDPETYMDWQVGDAICDSNGIAANGRIIFRSGDFVAADFDGCMCYTCKELFISGYRLVLTDIEQQIIGEKKKAEWTPQDGDICYAKSISGYCDVFIFKAGWKRTTYYASCRYPHEEGTVMNDRDIDNLRSATDNEKLQLFGAMAKIGKRWNAEKKVVEDIPKPHEFKKGEPVLVRDYGGFWKIGVFTKMQDSHCKYMATTDGVDECGYRQCIPYNERTMHLLGTYEDYKEEQL